MKGALVFVCLLFCACANYSLAQTANMPRDVPILDENGQDMFRKGGIYNYVDGPAVEFAKEKFGKDLDCGSNKCEYVTDILWTKDRWNQLMSMLGTAHIGAPLGPVMYYFICDNNNAYSLLIDSAKHQGITVFRYTLENRTSTQKKGEWIIEERKKRVKF